MCTFSNWRTWLATMALTLMMLCNTSVASTLMVAPQNDPKDKIETSWLTEGRLLSADEMRQIQGQWHYNLTNAGFFWDVARETIKYYYSAWKASGWYRAYKWVKRAYTWANISVWAREWDLANDRNACIYVYHEQHNYWVGFWLAGWVYDGAKCATGSFDNCMNELKRAFEFCANYSGHCSSRCY